MDRTNVRDSEVRWLQRIAQTLDLPVERLATPAGAAQMENRGEGQGTAHGPGPSAGRGIGRGASDVEQAAELLRLFRRISDPDARARCLAYVAGARGAPA